MPLILPAGDVQFVLTPAHLRAGLWYLGVLVAAGATGWGAVAVRSTGCAGGGSLYDAGTRALWGGLLALAALGVAAALGVTS